jgi:TRAP-type C4-dicarboxylate transport system substrate-binding protein
MRKITIVSLIAAFLTLAGRSASADEIVIKLGTSAPQGSPWHTGLKQAAQKWRELSGGRVNLRIFAGGTMGDEGDMIKKMHIGQLQAAALSTIGLHDITPEPQAIDLPLTVKNYEERDYLLKQMAPELETALAAKGFVVLTWSEIGFTRFFSNVPRPTLELLRQAKLFCWNGDPASTAAWKAGNFHPVLLSAVDMLPSLQTGMIDTVLYPPVLVFSLRLYEKAKYMMDMPYSTLTGATVVDKKVWDQIPADLQQKLRQVFLDLGTQGTQDARRFENEALTKMKAQGLQVVPITDLPNWEPAVKAVHSAVRGKVVPEKTFDEVQRIVKEYRAAHGTK